MSESLPCDTDMFIIFWYIFLFSFGVQMLLWTGLWRGLNYGIKTDEGSLSDTPYISIVIPYKNEEVHLAQNLTSIINQNYPNFEVILVNDHSVDKGPLIVHQFSEAYEQVRHYKLSGLTGKKHALTYGVSLARGEWLAFTDADCTPSKHWLASMIKNNHQADVVLGYGPYEDRGGLLNHLIRYEAWLIALHYMTASNYGLYYMAVGRNMLIKKKALLQVKGFDDHINVMSGSDDLLMKSLSTTNCKVKYALEPSSYVYAKPKETWLTWYNQKKRHVSTSIHYRFKAKILLSLIAWSHICFAVLAVYFLCQELYFFYTLGIVLIRALTMMSVSNLQMQKLKERGLYYIVPLLDFLLALFYISLSFTLFFKPKKW